MYGNGDAVAPATYYPTEVDKAMIAEGSVVPSEVTNAWTNWSRAILFLILIWPRFNFRPNDIIDNTFCKYLVQ